MRVTFYNSGTSKWDLSSGTIFTAFDMRDARHGQKYYMRVVDGPTVEASIHITRSGQRKKFYINSEGARKIEAFAGSLPKRGDFKQGLEFSLDIDDVGPVNETKQQKTEMKNESTVPKKADFDTSDLNADQQKAFDDIREYLDKPNMDMFLLAGYAGTGKTYLVNRVLKYINSKHPMWKTAITAPTNKAVKVLMKAAINNVPVAKKVDYSTIHKLLGLTEEIKDDGTIEFTKKKFDVNSIESYQVVVVDEVSMLDDKLFLELNTYRNRVKLIFTGDPAQIPPVNKPDCIPFRQDQREQYPMRVAKLAHIMRQAQGNPIIESSFAIRNNISKNYPIENVESKTDDKGHGLIRLDANLKEDRDRVMTLFGEYFNCDSFKNNSDYAKVIAWRNVTVNSTNNIIRGILFGPEMDKIMVGEKLVANRPITDGPLTIIFNNGDEFTVEDIDVANDIYIVNEKKVRLSYYDTNVVFTDIDDKDRKRAIKILHEDSAKEFKTLSDELKNFAIKTKQGSAWKKYYDFIRMFADVNYSYCSTVHKAQGSTYTNVFVLEDDLDKNPNIAERNRIKYTSYTRASERLFVLKR